MNTAKLEEKKKLSVGIDAFEKIIRQNFNYVDKTEMIAELLQNWGEVNLITRPRWFGKSLNNCASHSRYFSLMS